MTKQEIIDQIRTEAGTRATKPEVKIIVDSVFELLSRGLKDEGRVNIANFGTFVVSRHKEKRGRNPQTGALILNPAHNVVRFKPSGMLKEFIQ